MASRFELDCDTGLLMVLAGASNRAKPFDVVAHAMLCGMGHASGCTEEPVLQVMALIAYLMEHKNNYGPHLIIVPNAVMVNWKSELSAWLPSARCGPGTQSCKTTAHRAQGAQARNRMLTV